MEKVKIVLTRATVVDGGPKPKGWAGSVDKKDAAYLMRLGKAVPAEKQTKAKAK